MSYRGQNIDSFFRNGLEHFQEAPPGDVWEAIIHTINSEKRRRNLVTFLRVAASTAAVIAIGGAMLFGLRFISPVSESTVSSSQGDMPDVIVQEENISPAFAALINDNNTSDRPVENIPVTGHQENEAEDGKTVMRESVNLEKIARKQALLYNDYRDEATGLIREETPLTSADIVTDQNETTYNRASSEQRERSDRFLMGFHITSAYSYRTLKGGVFGDTPKAYFNGFESGIGSVSPGITFSYLLTPSIEIQVGGHFARMGQSIRYSNKDKIISVRDQNTNTLTIQSSTGSIAKINPTVFFVGHTTATGKPAEPGNTFQKVSASSFRPINGNIEQKFTYFQIPLSARLYLLNNENSRFFISGGVSANILIGNEVVLQRVNEQIPIGKTVSITDINFGGRISGGIEQSITNDVYISLEPVFNFFLTPINPDQTVNSYPYSFGLSTMIRYRF